MRGLGSERMQEDGHGEIGAHLWDAIAARGRPRRGERCERGSEEWARRAGDHAPDRGQQRRDRIDISSVDRSLFRHVSGNLEAVSYPFSVFGKSTRMYQTPLGNRGEKLQRGYD